MSAIIVRITIQKWRLKICLALLWPLRFAPRNVRDAGARWIAPQFAKWIAGGIKLS